MRALLSPVLSRLRRRAAAPLATSVPVPLSAARASEPPAMPADLPELPPDDFDEAPSELPRYHELTDDPAAGFPSRTPAHAASDGGRSAADRSTQGRSRATSLRLLTEIALDGVWTPSLAADLASGRSLVILIEVPAATWVTPIREAVAERVADRRTAFTTLKSRPRDAGSPQADLDIPMALGTGELMIAITPEAQWLSPVLVAATDHALKPVPLTPDELGEAIRRWTGRPLRRPLSAGDIAGLDLPDLAAALRPGMTAAACRRHLQQASRRRVGPPPSAHEIVPLAALTGLGEAHAWATDLVACIERVRAGRLPASALEGCVLFGRPGTGKTSLARSVAAAAGIPFIETSVGAWFSTSSGNLDGVVKAVDKFCDSLVLAAKAAGTGGLAIGFVDELDALPHRGRLSDRGADWWLPVVTHTLTRVESLRQRGIILIAATNDLSRIDPALLRPGRFDRCIEVPPPDEAGRLAALRHHLGRDLRGSDLTPAVRLSRGATGAVLAGAVRTARRQADAEGRAVRLDDLLTAIAPTDMRRPAVVRSTALHEAGHAVLALRLGLTVVQVSIMTGAHSGGATTIRVDDPTPNREALERQVVSTLAGRAADVVLGGGADSGSGSDLREATRLVAATHAAWGLGDHLLAPLDHERAEELLRTDLELARLVERDLQRLQWAAEWLAKANSAAILAVADALLDARVLTGAEVQVIVGAHPPRVRVRAGSSRSSTAAASGA